jgi:hypothetical protein
LLHFIQLIHNNYNSYLNLFFIDREKIKIVNFYNYSNIQIYFYLKLNIFIKIAKFYLIVNYFSHLKSFIIITMIQEI